VAVIESASLPGERRLVTTLAELGAAVADLDGPALLIVGEVAGLAETLGVDHLNARFDLSTGTH
jgi:uroporphyrin-III C-methyltransferase